MRERDSSILIADMPGDIMTPLYGGIPKLPKSLSRVALSQDTDYWAMPVLLIQKALWHHTGKPLLGWTGGREHLTRSMLRRAGLWSKRSAH